MSAPALSSMPARFAAGTTVVYTRRLANFSPTDGWTLKLYLAGVVALDPIEGSPSGSAWVVTIPATAELKAGNYQWVERVSKGAEVYDVAPPATVEVLPNIASANAGDLQSKEEQWLAVVEAALDNRLTGDMQSYQILGRAVTKIPVSELLALRSSLRAAVRQQRSGGKLGQVRATFTGTGAER